MPNSIFTAQAVSKQFNWFVFPADPATKVPCIYDWQRNASNDPDGIAEIFAKFPDAMVAVPTGPLNEISVMDIDIRPTYNGFENLFDKGIRIPRTPVVVTPSGGAHIYFRTDKTRLDNSVSKIAKGVDFRGEGGYVITAPSKNHKGLSYTWEPDWHDPKKGFAEIPEKLLRQIKRSYLKGYKFAGKSNIAKRMNNLINEGNRNDEMTKRCGYLFNKYKPQEVYSMMLKINQRCCLPPLSEKEVTQIFKSISRREAR